MTKKEINLTKEVEELITELIDLIGIKASAKVMEQDLGPDSDLVLHVTIDSAEASGLLIGSRGATLNALQSFLAMAVRQRLGKWVRINLDIGDWKKKQEDYLRNLGLQAVERAHSTGEPQYLYNLSSSQRRVIHLALSDKEDVDTHSEGEGEGRYLVIKPK